MPSWWTEVGVLAFAVIKVAGYTAAGFQLRQSYRESAMADASNAEAPSEIAVQPARHRFSVNPFLFGISLTGVGLASGFALATTTVTHEFEAFLFFYLGLLPVRIAEWSLLIWLFYARNQFNGCRLTKQSLIGTGWSYLLDFLAIMGANVIVEGMG